MTNRRQCRCVAISRADTSADGLGIVPQTLAAQTDAPAELKRALMHLRPHPKFAGMSESPQCFGPLLVQSRDIQFRGGTVEQKTVCLHPSHLVY